MAVYPNSDCVAFCDWMLNVSWQQLTPPRLNLITAVYNAGIASTSVTDNQWNNFTQVTAWRYKYYLVWKNLQGGYSSAALDWFAQLDVQPSAWYKSIINTFILQCISDGNWQYLDRFWIFATEKEQHCTISLVNPTSQPLSIAVQPTWAPLFGYTTNGSSQYLNSNYTPSIDGVNLTLNNASFGAYSRTNNTNVGGFLGVRGAPSNTCAIWPRDGSNNAYVQVNSQTYTQGTVLDTRGLFSAVRTASNNQDLYRNGALALTDTDASTGLPNLKAYILAVNLQGVLDVPNTRQISLAYFGSGSINQATFYTAVQALATSIGFNV